MKNSKTCLKCGGRNIVMIMNDGRNIYAGNSIKCGLTAFSYIFIERYICCDCGYTEEWIHKDDISKLVNSKKVENN